VVATRLNRYKITNAPIENQIRGDSGHSGIEPDCRKYPLLGPQWKLTGE
jgi:hypothetical protein